ncbi:4Fe-4S dicluster domain-containing protein [Thermococcus sp. M39]|uniref:4Fe-4S dicluster domain-containing protein n=1 Tax=unclassified Thermococcus TaxID=2627626 RepID=UPI00143A4ADB|nr:MULTISPECIES: 4Fe-4S dicluster domain-containing protein [unclassified Thermococcus]NJE08028.1 4Fe-4S dicluster domain-containing protein [Thermococcus sp. M39]NJE11521.1 4Fe-4S dicluster domain-containing protein [Thermococcus sp. LS2]
MAVTLKYPFVKIEAPPEYRGLPHIDPSLCIGCGGCVNVCPADALLRIDDYEKGTRRIVLDIGRCIRCARCEEVCPPGAIKLTQEFEAASPDKRDFVEVVELKLVKCRVCGRYADYTERQVKKALHIIPEEIIEEEALEEKVYICRDCRRKVTVEKSIEALKEVVE